MDIYQKPCQYLINCTQISKDKGRRYSVFFIIVNKWYETMLTN